MKGICFMLACFMAFSVGLYGQEALTIDDIIEMVKAKLRSRTIIQKVNISSMESAPSADDIVKLKKAGASRRIIEAVLAAPVTGPSVTPATVSPIPSPAPWNTSSTMAPSQPEATSPEPTSGGLEKGAYSHFEVFGGFSYFRSNVGASGFNLNGWNSAFVTNINQWFGIIADVSGLYGSPFQTPGFDTQENVHAFLFGPQYSFRSHSRIIPFARGLFGLMHEQTSVAPFSVSNIGLAYGFGGGVDIRISEKLAVRAAQFDYINIRVSGVGSNNLRLSFGIVAGL
jgi:hypothetical protein